MWGSLVEAAPHRHVSYVKLKKRGIYMNQMKLTKSLRNLVHLGC